MAELKIFIPDDLDLRFRKAAMNNYGYGRGSISKAATEAIAEWCKRRESAQTAAGTPETKTRDGTRSPEKSLSSNPGTEGTPVAGGT